jgi:hypothetical protein
MVIANRHVMFSVFGMYALLEFAGMTKTAYA